MDGVVLVYYIVVQPLDLEVHPVGAQGVATVPLEVTNTVPPAADEDGEEHEESNNLEKARPPVPVVWENDTELHYPLQGQWPCSNHFLRSW